MIGFNRELSFESRDDSDITEILKFFKNSNEMKCIVQKERFYVENFARSTQYPKDCKSLCRRLCDENSPRNHRSLCSAISTREDPRLGRKTSKGVRVFFQRFPSRLKDVSPSSPPIAFIRNPPGKILNFSNLSSPT